VGSTILSRVSKPVSYAKLFDLSSGAFLGPAIEGNYSFDGTTYYLPKQINEFISVLQKSYNDDTIAFNDKTGAFTSNKTRFVGAKIEVKAEKIVKSGKG